MSENIATTFRGKGLPDKIDTRKVVEMIRNADLYDLINISLRSTDLSNDSVEQFIKRALEKRNQDACSRSDENMNSQMLTKDNARIYSSTDLIFTPPSKMSTKELQSMSPTKR